MANSEEMQAAIMQVGIQAATTVERTMRGQSHQTNYISEEASQKNTADHDKLNQ